MISDDRFTYQTNIGKASSYRDRRSPFWPPASGYRLHCLDLSAAAPALGKAFFGELAALGTAIRADWETCKQAEAPGRTRLHQPGPVAEALRRLAVLLPRAMDRETLMLRADAIEFGYDDDRLAALARMEEEVTVVAGQIATWYGKQTGGLPTAFACARDDRLQGLVADAAREIQAIPPYLARLHKGLRLGEPPTFMAASVFFMAGEGNLHPKHIAYFLPEDEGVKRSPFKKTYYFANTHATLLAGIAGPLHARFADIGVDFDPAADRFSAIPTLGVLAHEFGHFVHRPGASFAALNAADRWVSVTLQETAADVFGTLILADVWAEHFDLRPADIVAYYLAECLRYIDRGLGFFPDSDGMLLQLNYFLRLGALGLETDPGPRLVGDPEIVLAALRSLARVLADVLLAGDADRAVAFHRAFGPNSPEPLRPLLDALRRSDPKSVEYVQEHIRPSLAVMDTTSRQSECRQPLK